MTNKGEKAVPQVTAADAAHGVLEAALTKLPLVGAITAWWRTSEQARQDRRAQMWAAAIEQDDPQLAARIADALDGPDQDFVRAGVLDSVRAVTDAIDDAVIAPIAKLTALYLDRSFDIFTFRELLALLKVLDAELVVDLKRAIDILHGHCIGDERTFFTEFSTRDDGADVWIAGIIPKPTPIASGGTPPGRFEILRSKTVPRLKRALLGGVGLFFSRGTPAHLSGRTVRILAHILA